MDNNQFPNDNGVTQPVDIGMTQPAGNMNFNQPQAGFNQGYPQQPQTGFNQGYPQQPQAGFNQGYPQQPQAGFNQGYPQQPQAGFNQGYPQQPQAGFNQGYPQQPQTGFNQGYPQQPQTGFNPGQNFGQPGYNMQGYGAPKQKKPLNKGVLIGILSAVCVAVIAIVLVLILKPKTGAKTKEEAATKFLEAWAGRDVDDLIKYSMPKQMRKSAEKYVKSADNYYYNADSLEEAYEMTYLKRSYSTVKIRNISVSTDEKYSSSDIQSFESYIKRNYDIDIDIQEMEEVYVDYEYFDDGYYNEWDDDYEYFLVYKVKGRWYVFPDYVIDD